MSVSLNTSILNTRILNRRRTTKWRSVPHGVLERKGLWHFKKWVWEGKEAGGDEKIARWRKMKELSCFFCLPSESLLPSAPLLRQSLPPRSIINLMSPVLLKLLLSIILLSWLFTNSIVSFWVQGHLAAWRGLTRGKEKKQRKWKQKRGGGMGEIAAPPTGRGWQCTATGKVWCSKLNYFFIMLKSVIHPGSNALDNGSGSWLNLSGNQTRNHLVTSLR